MAWSGINTTYTYVYDVFGATVYEQMVVGHGLQHPDDISANGMWQTKLSVVSKRTYSYDDPSLNSNDSSIRIGVYAPTRVSFFTDPGDAFTKIEWDGTYYKPSSLSMTVAWNLTLPNSGLGFTVSYNDSETHNSHSFVNWINPDGNGKYCRQLRHEWAGYKQQLRSVGHFFDVNVYVSHYETAVDKESHAKFEYDISTIYDYTWGGIQTKTMSYEYYSHK